MSKNEIRELIEEVFDEKIRMGLTRIENMQREFSDRKDRLIQEENVNEDDPRVQSLQTEIDNLYIATKVCDSLKVI